MPVDVSNWKKNVYEEEERTETTYIYIYKLYFFHSSCLYVYCAKACVLTPTRTLLTRIFFY